MDGKGVYAWITANYLLEIIKADTPKDTPIYAVLNLSGVSIQIVFDPMFSSSDTTLKPGLMMRASKHVHSLVDFMASIQATPPSNKETSLGIVGNPCLAQGMQRVVEVSDEKMDVKWSVAMDGDEVWIV